MIGKWQFFNKKGKLRETRDYGEPQNVNIDSGSEEKKKGNQTGPEEDN
jgi:hypothetical protein